MKGLFLADPFITPILIGWGVSATLAPVLSSIIVGVITTSVGVVIATIFAPKPPKPDDGKNPIQQTLPPRSFAYGLTRMSGAVCFLEAPVGRLLYAAAVTAHKIDAVIRHYLHDDVVQLCAKVNDAGFIAYYVCGWVERQAGEHDDNRYREGSNGRVFLYDRLGDAPSDAFDHLVINDPGIWTTSHRGDGCATMGMLCSDSSVNQQAKCYPFGIPKPSWELKGYHIFDPRLSDADVGDPDTYIWSENPALILLHYLCLNDLGPQRSYAVAIEPVLDEWIKAADDCDEGIPLKNPTSDDSTVRRYYAGGWANTDNEPKQIIGQILAACDGHLVERGDGTIILKVGKFEASTVTITDEDILGFYTQNDIPDEEVINRLGIAYTADGAFKYSLVDVEPIDNAADQAARGYVRESRAEYVWIHSAAVASRLAKREMYRMQRTRGYLKLRLSAINACYERFVFVDSSIVPGMAGVWIETRQGSKLLMSNGGLIHLEFIIIDPTAYDLWVPSVDERDPPDPPGVTNSSGPNPPEGVSIVTEQFKISSGKFGIRLAVSFDDLGLEDVSADYRYVVHWRQYVVTGDPDPWDEQTFDTLPDPVAGRFTLRTRQVEGDTVLEWGIASIASLQTRSDFVSDTDGLVTTTVDTVAPAVVENATYQVHSDFIRLLWDAPNSSNFNSAKVYRNTANVFGSSTIQVEVFGSPGSAMHYNDHAVIGGTTYYYWITPVNGSGVEGTETPTGAIAF